MNSDGSSNRDAERNSDSLKTFLVGSVHSQRERLAILVSEWTPAFEAMDDDELLRSLRLVRKTINSKKLKAACVELIGKLRRDGLSGAAKLPKPTPTPTPTPTLETSAETNPSMQAPDPNRNLELEALIAANPRAREPYLVYGDWLEERGLRANGRIKLGPLDDCQDMLSETNWHLGFLRKARLRYTLGRFNGEAANVTIEQALEWLLENPGPGRFLADLTVGLVRHDDNNYGGVCRVIGSRSRPALERLFLGDFEYSECELNWSDIEDASPMWAALPRLRSLTLRGGSMTLGDIVLPELLSFTTVSGGMSGAALASIASASWPKLEKMSLQVGPEGASDAALVDPILNGTGLPELRHLGLTNCNFTAEICTKLANSKILPQLKTLDLSMGTMGPESARLLHENRGAFAHLDQIDVADNYLSDDSTTLLAGICKSVIVGDQRDDDEGPSARYASTFE